MSYLKPVLHALGATLEVSTGSTLGLPDQKTDIDLNFDKKR